MKQRFFKYFSIAWLSLAIVVAPALACACAEPVSKSHTCCPQEVAKVKPSQDTQTPNSQAPQSAKGKRACCEFHGVAPQKMEGASLDKAPLLVAYSLAPEITFAWNNFSPKFYRPQFYQVEGSTSPPLLFLKHHSFLL